MIPDFYEFLIGILKAFVNFSFPAYISMESSCKIVDWLTFHAQCHTTSDIFQVGVSRNLGPQGSTRLQ